MASVASQVIEEVTAHAQSDCLEDAREICADGTYFPNNLPTYPLHVSVLSPSSGNLHITDSNFVTCVMYKNCCRQLKSIFLYFTGRDPIWIKKK